MFDNAIHRILTRLFVVRSKLNVFPTNLPSDLYSLGRLETFFKFYKKNGVFSNFYRKAKSVLDKNVSLKQILTLKDPSSYSKYDPADDINVLVFLSFIFDTTWIFYNFCFYNCSTLFCLFDNNTKNAKITT